MSRNFRSNVLETLRWFCSELRSDEIDRSLRELFSGAPRCKLLECSVVTGDESGTQGKSLHGVDFGVGDSATVIHSGSDCIDSLYSLVQLELGGISNDGLSWDARINLAAKSSSEHVWNTILRDISCTSPYSLPESAPSSDVTPLVQEAIENSGIELGLEIVARELAHEMRSPLSAITTSVGLVTSDAEADQVFENDELLRIIELNADRIDSMLTDFVKMNRYPALAKDPSNLMELVAEVAGDCSTGANGDIQIELPNNTESILVEADTELIKHAFRHVLSVLPRLLNNCKRVCVRCLKKGNLAILEFKFDGKGTGPDILRKVVLPFNTAKDGGAGLEFLPVHTIVGAHGGKTVIELSDAETVLTITLPALSSKKKISTK